MALEKLEFGDSVAGLLINGVDDTPYMGATMHMRSPRGVSVEIPYLRGGQFKHVEEWFDKQSPPGNMEMLTAEGAVSFFDVEWMGHTQNSGRRAALGKLRPQETVLSSRDGKLADPLVVQVARSRIDGLNRWIREESITDRPVSDDNSKLRKLGLEVERVVAAVWTQGDATLTLHTDWRVESKEDAAERSRVIHDNFVLDSEFTMGPRPFWDHLVEQRKLANLVVFVFGRSISFRRHKVQDDRFTARLMGGKVYNHPFVELISAETVRERARPIQSTEQFGRPLASLAAIGPDGLSAWAASYTRWERFILPAISALSRSDAFAEEAVTMTSMALEAAGSIIGEREGERATYRSRGKTTATYVYRCLHVLRIGWGPYISSDAALAWAIANNYNGVKHYDRGDLPPGEQTLVLAQVGSLIARLLALHLTGKGDELLKGYRDGNELWPVQQEFDSYGVRIVEGGKWENTRDE